ncbi:hypothetical protein D3C72_1525060 [compost metagenome]
MKKEVSIVVLITDGRPHGIFPEKCSPERLFLPIWEMSVGWVMNTVLQLKPLGQLLLHNQLKAKQLQLLEKPIQIKPQREPETVSFGNLPNVMYHSEMAGFITPQMMIM